MLIKKGVPSNVKFYLIRRKCFPKFANFLLISQKFFRLGEKRGGECVTYFMLSLWMPTFAASELNLYTSVLSDRDNKKKPLKKSDCNNVFYI